MVSKRESVLLGSVQGAWGPGPRFLQRFLPHMPVPSESLAPSPSCPSERAFPRRQGQGRIFRDGRQRRRRPSLCLAQQHLLLTSECCAPCWALGAQR